MALRGLTADEALAVLRRHVKGEDSQIAFARKHGLSDGMLSETLNGLRPISGTVAALVGLDKQALYVPVSSPKKKRK